jgi:hypothetical protein
MAKKAAFLIAYREIGVVRYAAQAGTQNNGSHYQNDGDDLPRCEVDASALRGRTARHSFTFLPNHDTRYTTISRLVNPLPS